MTAMSLPSCITLSFSPLARRAESARILCCCGFGGDPHRPIPRGWAFLAILHPPIPCHISNKSLARCLLPFVGGHTLMRRVCKASFSSLYSSKQRLLPNPESLGACPR